MSHRTAFADGLDAAVKMLRLMGDEPIIRLCSDPAALRLMANAIEASAKQ